VNCFSKKKKKKERPESLFGHSNTLENFMKNNAQVYYTYTAHKLLAYSVIRPKRMLLFSIGTVKNPLHNQNNIETNRNQ